MGLRASYKANPHSAFLIPAAEVLETTPIRTGPAILAVKGDFKVSYWYRSSYGTDFDISEIESPVEVCS